jgi:uncharacterized protein DUF4282
MDIVNRFLNFDKLMGQSLVKIVYYLGIIGIVLSCVMFIFTGFGVGGFGGGLGALIAAPIFGIISLCFLRFFCELYIAIFRMSDDLTAIRGGGGGAMTPPKA